LKKDIKISAQAAARKFHLPHLSRYYLRNRRAQPGLLLNYAGTPPKIIRRTVRALATIFQT